MRLNLVSLFDGMGGFPLALCNVLGERPEGLRYWSSEIEPWPCEVVRTRFPRVRELGDVTRICPARLRRDLDDAPTVVTFGSPCQDLSMAGQRRGLAGERSGLFYAATRLIRELRPEYAIWENVAGAFSTNDGRDFLAVLREFADLGYSSCYTLVDAQWFGVPQRRRRVFLLAARDGIAAGCDPFEFERRAGDRCAESVQSVAARRQRHSAAGGQARESIAALTANGPGAGGGVDDNAGQAGQVVVAARQVAFGEYTVDGTASTAKQRDSKDATDLIAFESKGSEVSPSEVSPTLRAMNGNNGGSHAAICASVAPCVTEGAPYARTGNERVECDALVAQGVSIRGREGGATAELAGGVSPALRSSQGGGDKGHVLAPLPLLEIGARTNGDGKRDGDGIGSAGDPMYTLQASKVHGVATPMIVRRLTPVECLRLQGFPDWWFDGVPGYSDTKAYKAIGNSVAIPCVEWVWRAVLGLLDGDGDA